MKLRQARVQNFRSIVDSGKVDIEEGVTVLIGKNEQGKTTFQKALMSLNENYSYSEKDFPNHLRAKLENTPYDQIPMVDAWFHFDAEDSKWTEAIPEIKGATGVRITKRYDDTYSYARTTGDGDKPLPLRPPDIEPVVQQIRDDLDGLRERFAAHATRYTSFAPSLEQANLHIAAIEDAKFDQPEQLPNLLKTFSTAMKALPAQDAAIQEDVTAIIETVSRHVKTIQGLHSTDHYAPIRNAMPRFVFHSTSMDRIPDYVSIAEFIANPEGTSRGMANLCAVAGLSTQKIKTLAALPDAADRETFEDHYRGTVSGGINEFWTQEKYTVHFRIESTRLSVSISDGSYAPRIAPSDRSDGFQWYLSFFAALLSEVSNGGQPLLLLLDNPGLELHADGQRDIKRFLDEKLSTQIIYVTHSPSMIDVFNLEQVRQVELRPNLQGTKIARLKVKSGDDFDLLEPVRSAIGASIASSLMFNDFNVLAEGAADRPILEGAFKRLREKDHKRVLITGSISESGGLLTKFYKRAGLPLVAFVDADSSGRDLKKQLVEWGLSEGQIVDLAKVFADRKEDFELEDIVSREFYHAAVEAAYPDADIPPPPDDLKGKRTKYYETQFKEKLRVGFVKRRVAETIKRLLAERKPDHTTSENLSKLTTAIWDALNAAQPKKN